MRVEFADARPVFGFCGVVSLDIELRAHVRAAAHSAVGAEEQGLREQLFGADEQGKIATALGDRHEAVQVLHVAAAVFEAANLFELAQGLDRARFEHELTVARHVVEEHRQRAAGDEAFERVSQLVLARGEVIRRCADHRVGAAVGGMLGHLERFVKRRIGDADEDGDAPGDLLADKFDEFAAKAVAEARGFAGGAEGKDAVDAAADDVLDDALDAGVVEFVVALEGGDDRGDDAGQ